jgi:hypothetical protein
VGTAFPSRVEDIGDVARLLRDGAALAVDFRPGVARAE